MTATTRRGYLGIRRWALLGVLAGGLMEHDKASPFVDAPKPSAEPKPGRFLARMVPSKRRCSNCDHFNRAVLQQELAQHPAFVAAATVLSPDRMGQVKPPDDDADAKKADDTRPTRTGARWSEMGACLKHNEGRWSGDCCKDWG